MLKNWIFACLAAAALTLCGCAAPGEMDDDDAADDQREQEVTLEQLPAAARATLTKEAGDGKIEEIDKRARQGKTEYEADVLLAGKKWEITVREDGQLLRKQLDEETDEEDDRDDDKEDDD
jgi:hypothetical protein